MESGNKTLPDNLNGLQLLVIWDLGHWKLGSWQPDKQAGILATFDNLVTGTWVLVPT